MADVSKWWACSVSNLTDFYDTNLKIGLSDTQAQKNAEKFGRNTFAELKPASTFSLRYCKIEVN